MDAYIYQAALLCEDCANKIITQLTSKGKAPANTYDETTYDSDDFPKGPYSNGGGEADSPQYCDQCREHLENPLTEDGVEQLRQSYVLLIVGGCRGIYVPKSFSEKYPQYLTKQQIKDLHNPKREHYWDTWDDVLSKTVMEDVAGHTYTLHQDGDLFAVRNDLPTYLQDQLNDSF